jgi:hypothetical protein
MAATAELGWHGKGVHMAQGAGVQQNTWNSNTTGRDWTVRYMAAATVVGWHGMGATWLMGTAYGDGRGMEASMQCSAANFHLARVEHTHSHTAGYLRCWRTASAMQASEALAGSPSLLRFSRGWFCKWLLRARAGARSGEPGNLHLGQHVLPTTQAGRALLRRGCLPRPHT